MKYRLVAVGLVLWIAGTMGPARADSEEKFDGYAEWRRDNVLIVDGQRVSLAPAGKFKGDGEATDFAAVPLGYEVSGKGTRLADGSLLASEIEAKPNGTAAFEDEVNQASADMETTWRQTGFVAEPGADGAMQNIGPLHTDGPDVERVREIVNRLVPPYLNPAAFRVYVVENPDWNAFACPNGMIVVYDSLLHAASDDEMAIILGHELTHVTHEHARKEFKDAMILQIIALGVEAAAAAVDSERAKAVIALASGFTLTAFKNGYGRDKEDQADRVGLRYAYEAGYDVRVGPPLWNRFAEKYGQSNALMNFFFGDHSRALDREKNLQREIAVNYASPVSATEAAGATLGSESTPPPTPPTKPTMPTLPTKPTMPTPPPKPTMTPTSGNLALHKSATQSSTYSPEYGAGVCVDGNRTGGWCHTNSEANPWWQVDLGGNYALSRIVVYNRADQWGAREHTIRALVSTDGRNWTTIYAHDGSDFQVLPIDAGNRIARYVRLQLAATDYLNLVEVEVYGTTPMECSTGLPNSKPGN